MQKSIPKIEEERLIVGLQPIRGFVLAQVLYHFMDAGIRDTIAISNELTITDLSKKLGLHEERLKGLLQFLANEGFVHLSNSNLVSLTDAGTKVADFLPWYKLFVGGYGQTFQQLPSVLQVDGPYASRNSSNIGVASCGISQHDALPMTRRLLESIFSKMNTVVDLGCGDGSYLIDLCRSMPSIRGIGVDPDQSSVEAAMQAARYYGIDDRVDVRVGKATTLPDFSQEKGPLCFITAFVLQEILEQSGRDTILEMLKTIFTRYPDAYWIVIEVDSRPNDPVVMTKGLGLAYYNSYYLIHKITEQKLERVEFWKQLFREAGLYVISIEYPDPSYDPLQLKVGFLLASTDKSK